MQKNIILTFGILGLIILLLSEKALPVESKLSLSLQQDFIAYKDSVGTVSRLSSEASEPFLFLGKQVTGVVHTEQYKLDIEKKYLSVIQRFPSVRECLLKEQRNVPQPDLAAFDWGKLDSTQEVEVCLFRIASSYAAPEDMKVWFEKQGMLPKLHTAVVKKNPVVEAVWVLDKNWPKFSANIFAKLWIKMRAYNQSFFIEYNEDNSVFTSSVVLTIE